MQRVPEAFLEIVKQYLRRKEILTANDPNGEVLDRVIVRFRGEIQDELGN